MYGKRCFESRWAGWRRSLPNVCDAETVKTFAGDGRYGVCARLSGVRRCDEKGASITSKCNI